jgi:hypothetical protein
VPSRFVKTHGTHQPSDSETPLDGLGEETNTIGNQNKGDPVIGSSKEPPLLVLQEATSSLSQMQYDHPASNPTTLGEIKSLVEIVKNAIKGWGQEETPTVLLLAVITIISQQLNAAGVQNLVHWDLCLMHCCFMQ